MLFLLQSILSVVRRFFSRSWGLLRLFFPFPGAKPFPYIERNRDPAPKTSADIPADALWLTLQREKGVDDIGHHRVSSTMLTSISFLRGVILSYRLQATPRPNNVCISPQTPLNVIVV